MKEVTVPRGNHAPRVQNLVSITTQRGGYDWFCFEKRELRAHCYLSRDEIIWSDRNIYSNDVSPFMKLIPSAVLFIDIFVYESSARDIGLNIVFWSCGAKAKDSNNLPKK